MAKVGEGTGQGPQPPSAQGLMANEDAEPNESGPTGAGDHGTGPKLAKGNRTTPLGKPGTSR